MQAVWNADSLAGAGPRQPFGLLVPWLPAELVHVAPVPVFPGLGRANERMGALLEVRRRVPVRGVVAAAHLSAAQAHPEVHPRAPDLQALLAAGKRLRQVGEPDLVEVGTVGAHIGSQANASTRVTALDTANEGRTLRRCKRQRPGAVR
jgi:hypothetical protein